MTDADSSTDRSLSVSIRAQHLGPLAVVLALLAVAGLAAGAITMDSETTDTTTTSDWTDGTTATDVHNSSKAAYLEFDSANATADSQAVVAVAVNDSTHPQNGTTIYEATYEVNATNATGNQYALASNVTYAEAFRYLEHDANETVTLDVTITVNESESSEETGTFQISADTAEDNARATVNDGEPEVNSEGQVGGLSLPGFLGGGDDPADAAAADQKVNVTTNTTTITVAAQNASQREAVNASVGDTTGELSTTVFVTVDGTAIPVFSEGTTASDVSWLDDNETYAVASTDGATVTVYNADQLGLSTSEAVSVGIEANDAVGFGTTRSMLTDRGAGTLTAVRAASGAADLNGDPFDDGRVGT